MVEHNRAIMKKVKDMTKDELEAVVEHCLGIWHESFSKPLPWVYCPFCGAKLKTSVNRGEKDADPV